MKKPENRVFATIQTEPSVKKQICLKIDGCMVKLNVTANKNEIGKIETVKRMILKGLVKV